MGQIFDVILNQPLGWVIKFCYDLVNNYGLAIILFTILVKLILFPLGIKQQKGSIAMLRMKPKEEAIRKKYAKDKEKLNQALMELYQDEGYSPMAGCLPLLIQFPIIFSLYKIINEPLTYILNLSQDTIRAIDAALNLGMIDKPGYIQIPIAEAMYHNADKIAHLLPEGVKPIDFNFFGINLAETPSFTKISLLWLIPILAGVMAWVSGWYMQKMNPAPQQANMKTMNLVMPIMSLIFCFQMPAGVGLYWSMSSVMSMVQSWGLNLIYNPKKIIAQMEEEERQKEEIRKKKKALMQQKLALERAEAEEAAKKKHSGARKYNNQKKQDQNEPQVPQDGAADDGDGQGEE
ncbi:YidC/Oxa1 family membrane protein insertase [Feifania hominis]|uniref:YidC/Oxa1 family membrane protein insertase n=1 Tax=Feifania hominis TaxID=2763660 RepID=A0A926DFU1_9FIRM|nr:YidC/Oxa1 family membrane protein insertase [Feifania hominis]MBC8537037.1 YidC/Oxa1 family membrane protein insertase [Feifania hominis]